MTTIRKVLIFLMSKFFSDKREDLVSDAVEGLLMTSHVPVARLQTDFPSNIVVRADWTKEKADSEVALICGGGSGHEPMHAGFVGDGMLTAAVCGELFASPSIDAVFAAILHVSGKAGTFVIVKAYTGDCLNFGLAVQKARALGIKVEMVIFSDDVSIPDHPRPRGLAGVILLYKILGFYAKSGKSLEEIVKISDFVKSRISTIGVAISSCDHPGAAPDSRVPPGKAELGLGIHGEPGVEVVSTQQPSQLLPMMLSKLFPNSSSINFGNYGCLINNLGGTSSLEMQYITRSILRLAPVKIVVGPSSLCTSLDMKGFSISFIELNEDIQQALLSPVSTNSWCDAIQVTQPNTLKPSRPIEKTVFTPSADQKCEKVIRAICDTLISAEESLNAIDARVGDGDAGSTFANAARTVLAELEKGVLPLADRSALFASIGNTLGSIGGGSAGVLLSIIAMQTAESLKTVDFGKSLLKGVQKMMELGGAKAGMRTMVDSLLPAAEALAAGEGIKKAAEAAEKGAEATKTMKKAQAGRSSYVSSENLQGEYDPGAKAIQLLFAAAEKALQE